MDVEVQAPEGNFEHLADQMLAMLREMSAERCFRSPGPDRWQPKLNFYETPDKYLICVELAGMRREEIDVSVRNGALYLRGTRKRPEIPTAHSETNDPIDSADAPSVSVHVMEIDSGPFHRKLPIASDSKIDEVFALYKQGYLWIVLPRATGTPPVGERE